MSTLRIDKQNLEIAIQTVLHHYHAELEAATGADPAGLIKEIAGEITRKAQLFQFASEHAMTELKDGGSGL